MNKLVIWPIVPIILLTLAFPTNALAEGAETAGFEGVLLDAAGAPAPDYPMAVKTPEGQRVLFNPTVAGGNFSLSGLPPGNYEVLVLPPDGGQTPLVSKKVTLVAGQKAKLEIRLTSSTPADPLDSTAGTGLTEFTWRLIVFAALAIGLAVGFYVGVRSRMRA